MDLVEVMGKKNNKVPVLLTPVMKASIELLNDYQDVCGVHKKNIYVFAEVHSFILDSHFIYVCLVM